MVRIYYHIYSIDGVESIIDEQLSLMEKHFNLPKFEDMLNPIHKYCKDSINNLSKVMRKKYLI